MQKFRTLFCFMVMCVLGLYAPAAMAFEALMMTGSSGPEQGSYTLVAPRTVKVGANLAIETLAKDFGLPWERIYAANRGRMYPVCRTYVIDEGVASGRMVDLTLYKTGWNGGEFVWGRNCTGARTAWLLAGSTVVIPPRASHMAVPPVRTQEADPETKAVIETFQDKVSTLTARAVEAEERTETLRHEADRSSSLAHAENARRLQSESRFWMVSVAGLVASAALLLLVIYVISLRKGWKEIGRVRENLASAETKADLATRERDLALERAATLEREYQDFVAKSEDNMYIGEALRPSDPKLNAEVDARLELMSAANAFGIQSTDEDTVPDILRAIVEKLRQSHVLNVSRGEGLGEDVLRRASAMGIEVPASASASQVIDIVLERHRQVRSVEGILLRDLSDAQTEVARLKERVEVKEAEGPKMANHAQSLLQGVIAWHEGIEDDRPLIVTSEKEVKALIALSRIRIQPMTEECFGPGSWVGMFQEEPYRQWFAHLNMRKLRRFYELCASKPRDQEVSSAHDGMTPSKKIRVFQGKVSSEGTDGGQLTN